MVDPLADTGKGFFERLWPVFACGAGLFSDGYINNVHIPFPEYDSSLTSLGHRFGVNYPLQDLWRSIHGVQC